MANGEKLNGWLIFFFIPALLILSCIFLLLPIFPLQSAAKKSPPIPADLYRVETARGTILENNTIIGNCHLCHAYWVPIPRSSDTSTPRFAHSDIELNHGRNDRCYNCHMISDRNKYVADDSRAIMPQLPEELCKRCHGLIYNDWQRGTHGKWTGMWNPKQSRDRKTYTCTQCHDPHAPQFKYTTVAPPPIWSKKFIRTKVQHRTSDSASQFMIEEAPKEIF